MLPEPRTPDPFDAPSLGWGIMGPGRIASAFATSLRRHTSQRLVAVGGRSAERAAAFAAAHGDPTVHASFEALVEDPAVDVVYIATPNPFHASCAMLAIEAGKHVLVEKPFAMDAPEAERVVAAARERGVFAMEAMWPRFVPATDVVRQLLDGDRLGDVHALLADLGEHFEPDPRSRLFDPALGGGALLDLGVYLVSYASFVLGEPATVDALGTFTPTGVDAQASMSLRGPGERVAHLYTTLEARTPTTAYVTGTAGTLSVHAPFYLPSAVTLSVRGADPVTREFAQVTPEDGLCFEAAEAARMIAQGRTESPLLPLDETLQVMRTLDAIRDQLRARRLG